MTAGGLDPRWYRGPVYVAGHRGLVGSAVCRHLRAHGVDPVGWGSAEVDLTDRQATLDAVTALRPAIVIVAAGRVGGIAANDAAPVEFLTDNVRIAVNVLEAAHRAAVPQLVYLGSSCIYPRMAPQPIPESALLTGPLEATNEAYALAKIAGIVGVQSYRRQYGRRWVSAMPTNLYGPGDNFDPVTAHVLPALLHRFHRATLLPDRGAGSEVRVWGTGTARREFLHVDDLARALVRIVDRYDDAPPINVGTGQEVTIADLAAAIAEVVDFRGRIAWDASRPDGTPRKVVDITRLRGLGWEPAIGFTEGLRETYRWYLDHIDTGADPTAPRPVLERHRP